jgi:hypothetical protein
MQTIMNLATGIVVGFALLLLVAERNKPIDNNLSMNAFYAAF